MSPTEPAAPAPVDLYREVHKGLRLALFELTGSAGAIDASNRTSVEDFARVFADVDMMLATHHGHEDGDLLVELIERHAPRAARRVSDAHETFDRQIIELRSLVAELTAGGTSNPDAIYDAVVAFTGAYLAHMDVEESDIMPALRAAVPADDLIAITMAIRTSVRPPDMCVFLRYMLPAMNPNERTATLGGMKAGAPPEIFELFWATAEASLPEADLAAVADRIAA